MIAPHSRSAVFSDDSLFEDEEKFIEDEHDDSDGDGSVNNEVEAAAPGDLGLAEAIDALTLDIEKLVNHESIVDNLMKKAELTNNAAELRILKKSKASLQREIRHKELQRQQYIVQESDNSLYGRASISIQNIMVGNEPDGKEFALYVIEVRRRAGESMPEAAWIVAKRYSEFHELNKRLRAQYPSIRRLEFPKRQVVLKLQKDFLEKRRKALQVYLRELLTDPAVCQSREMRAFLSQRTINSTTPTDSQTDSKDFVTRIYNSVTDGIEEFLGNIPVLDQLSLAGQNLISAATTQLGNAGNTQSSTTTIPSGVSTIMGAAVTAAEAEAEIRAFEGKELEPFVKPICDLFLETFSLNRENNWLRGRAVVVVLHQLLGGTVERKVRDAYKNFVEEDSIVKYINMAKDMMWPGGKRKPQSTPRTDAERAKSRREANAVLDTLLPEMVGTVVGRQNAQVAAKRVEAVVNNKRLK